MLFGLIKLRCPENNGAVLIFGARRIDDTAYISVKRLLKHKFSVVAVCHGKDVTESLQALCHGNKIDLQIYQINDSRNDEEYSVLDEIVQSQHHKIWSIVICPNHPDTNLNQGHHAWLTTDDLITCVDQTLLYTSRIIQYFGHNLRHRHKSRLCIVSHTLADAHVANYITYAPYAALNAYCHVLMQELAEFNSTVHILEPSFHDAISRHTQTQDLQLVSQSSYMNLPFSRKSVENCWENASAETKNEFGEAYFNKYMSRYVRVQENRQLRNGVENVSSAILHVCTSRFPKQQYLVGLHAKFTFGSLGILPNVLKIWILKFFRKMIGGRLPKPAAMQNNRIEANETHNFKTCQENGGYVPKEKENDDAVV